MSGELKYLVKSSIDGVEFFYDPVTNRWVSVSDWLTPMPMNMADDVANRLTAWGTPSYAVLVEE